MAILADGFEPPKPSPSPSGVSGVSSLGALSAMLGQPLAGTGGPQEAADDPRLFLGTKRGATVRRYDRENDLLMSRNTRVDRTRSFSELMNEFEKMPNEKKRKLALQLLLGGYIGPTDGIDLDNIGAASENLTLQAVEQGYMSLLEDAAMRFAGGQKITPMELLRQRVDYRLKDKDWDGSLDSLDSMFGGSGEEGFTGTRTRTDKRVDLMDPADAKALVRALLQNELGRDPTQAEFEDFTATLRAAERANPSEVTTTTRFEDGIEVDSQSTVNQGISGDGLAEKLTQQARNDPSWAEWQAMGTYAPALFEALGSGIPGA